MSGSGGGMYTSSEHWSRGIYCKCQFNFNTHPSQKEVAFAGGSLIALGLFNKAMESKLMLCTRSFIR